MSVRESVQRSEGCTDSKWVWDACQPEAPCSLCLLVQVLVLMSSGVATPWQVGSGTFSQHLEQAARADSAMTCKALAELSAFSTPVRDLAQAFQVQLTGLRQEAAMVDNQPQSTRSDLYKVGSVQTSTCDASRCRCGQDGRLKRVPRAVL